MGTKNRMTKPCFLFVAWVCSHVVCGFAHVGVGMAFLDPWSLSKTVSSAGGASHLSDIEDGWEIVPVPASSVEESGNFSWEDGWVCIVGGQSSVTLGQDSTYQARFFHASAATEDFWRQTGADKQEHAWQRNEGSLMLAVLALRSGGRESSYQSLSDEEKQQEAGQGLSRVCQSLGVRLKDIHGNSEVSMMLARSLSNHLSERFIFVDAAGEEDLMIHKSPFYPVCGPECKDLLDEALEED